ncbi:alpha-galactosidase [Micromonospora sp. NPDC049559]|uniref:alpha-galactosidase n=1 Tax=Micromonospora sp. NPDC049559 TaxID=3155923 RepID=UPI003434DBE2
MTDVETAPADIWLPGGGAQTRPENPVRLPEGQATAGLRLRAGGAAEVRVTELGPGVVEVVFGRLDEPLTVTATISATDAVAWWRPGSGVPHATIPPSWAQAVDVTALQDIPLGALLTRSDATRLVYALDAATSPTLVRAGLVEETAEFVVMLTVTGPPAGDVRLYLDSSGGPFATAAPGAGGWLQGPTGHRPAPGATDPVLCTWYFAHQHVSAATIESAADRAAELGFGTLIVDDGWQTTSHGRGYGSCGDWEVATEKFPDPAGLVRRLRARGIRTVWWIGTPFLGHRARARDLGLATLYDEPDLDAEVLDPRDPATRAYLVGRIRDLVESTEADGVKLDFLERFVDRPDGGPSVAAAAVRAMEEVVAELRGVGIEPLVEFREPYVHPAVARVASMIRVADCPLSPVQNRVGIVDLRLARPGTPIHSDPIMWTAAESPERVAHHLINGLLGVPQVSVDLLGLREEQAEALAFWLGVWREHRDLLLHGELRPERPDLSYPVVHARSGARRFVVRYAPMPVAIPDEDWTEILLANADDSAPILRNEADETRADLRVWDARGRLVARDPIVLPPGPTAVDVPTGGLARLRRIVIPAARA